MPSPHWLEYEGKTTAFRTTIDTHVDFNTECYHALIEYAAKVKKQLANPQGKRLNWRLDHKWYAHQVSRKLLAAAAAHIAVAKAMRAADEVFTGGFQGNAAGHTVVPGGFNLDK